MLLPLIVVYMLSLVLAAWPSEIRPEALDGISGGSRHVLETVGIRAGMPVFFGSKEKYTRIIRGRCIVVEGTDRNGRRMRLHPGKPCIPVGFRWRPVIYEHMLLSWSWSVERGIESPNLWAMGDHFCNSSLGRNLQSVDISVLILFMDYETGRETPVSNPVGHVTCRR